MDEFFNFHNIGRHEDSRRFRGYLFPDKASQCLFQLVLACHFLGQVLYGLFAFFILGERPSEWFYLVLASALTGVILISIPQITSSTQPINYIGLIAVLCSLAAAIFWGGSTVFGRILTKKVDFWDLTLLRYVGGFTFLLVLNLCLFTYNHTYFGLLTKLTHVFGYDTGNGVYRPLDWQWPIGLSIIYFALLTGGVIPLGIYYFGLKRSRAAIAGLAELAFPLLAIFVNYYFLNEGLNTLQIIGAVILMGSVSILSYLNALEFEKNRLAASKIDVLSQEKGK